jgi:heme-degrading monooxygenase HmoA
LRRIRTADDSAPALKAGKSTRRASEFLLSECGDELRFVNCRTFARTGRIFKLASVPNGAYIREVLRIKEGAMHARLTKYAIPEDRVDDFIQAFEGRMSEPEETRPSDAYLLIDRGAGKALSFSLWESDQAMTTGAEEGARSRQRVLDASGASVSSTSEFEVALHLGERQPA